MWAGTGQTKEPGKLDKEIRGYVDTLIEALMKDGLLPTG